MIGPHDNVVCLAQTVVSGGVGHRRLRQHQNGRYTLRCWSGFDPNCDATYKDKYGQPVVAAPTFCSKCKTGRPNLIPGKEKPFWSCSNFRNEAAQCWEAYPDRCGMLNLNQPTKPFKLGMTKAAYW